METEVRAFGLLVMTEVWLLTRTWTGGWTATGGSGTGLASRLMTVVVVVVVAFADMEAKSRRAEAARASSCCRVPDPALLTHRSRIRFFRLVAVVVVIVIAGTGTLVRLEAAFDVRVWVPETGTEAAVCCGVESFMSRD